MFNRKTVAGFSLIELMITLAIAVILATLATPSFRSYIANQRAKAVSYDLVASLNFARSEAIKRNTAITVAADTNWSNGWTVTISGTTTKLREYTPSGDVIITDNGVIKFDYNGDGRLAGTATAPALSICGPANTEVFKRVVTVDLGGRPNLAVDGNC